MEDKTTATLNLVPSGIDYTTFLAFLDTNSGCVYNEFGKKITREESDKRRKTENIILVCQGYRPYGYDVCVVGDEYLSVVRYATACSASRVKEWCANEKKGIINDADAIYAFGREGRRYYDRILRKERKYSLSREVRIYKDGSATQVIGVEYDNGEKLYLCINPEIYTNSKLSSSNRWYGAIRLGTMGDCIDSPEAQKTLETKAKDSDNNDTDINFYVRVYTDEDVKATAVKSCGKHKHIGGLFGFTEMFEGNMIEAGYLSEDSSLKFGDKLTESIANFFGMKDTEGEGYEKMQIYKSKYGSHISPASKLYAINLWSTIQLKHYAARKAQQAKCDSIWNSVHWEKPGKVSWERRGDEIIMAIQDKNDYREIKTVFVYNVKTNKKNFYRAETSGSHTWGSLDEPKPMIPSIKTILEHCGVISTPCTYEYTHGKRIYTIGKPLKAVMVNGITVHKLFAGTNVEWILNNVDNIGEYEIAAPEICYRSYGCYMYTIKQRLVDIINDEHIGVTALLVLITTGNKLMEQLLKNKLFNLYFAEIEGRVKEEYVFEDIDHLKTAHYHVRIPYHGKEKSLKKMMMMSGDQIKFINDHILLEPIEKSEYDKDEPFDRYTYQLPNLMYACEVLGIDSLASVNSEMFDLILKLSTHKQDNNSRCIWKTFGGFRHVNKLMEPMNVKAKLEFMQKYLKADVYDGIDLDALNTYNDYLQMRNSLMALQDKYPDKDIFNPHHYPIKVGKSVKFIHYIEGMGDTTRTWVCEPIDSPDKFVEYVMRFFSEYGKASELSIRERLVYDEDGELIGFKDELTPTKTLKYLHDEMSRWLSIYEDETRAAEFERALERVRPLEWSDEKTGLSIVAPRAIEEIKNEGSVLSHCVAGYVDPICQGTENIMFIRRTDMIDEPYFTLDLTPDGVIRQIHCYANGDTRPEDIKAAYEITGRPVYNEPRDILGFVKNWIKAMKGKVKDENIHPTYCRLCALR